MLPILASCRKELCYNHFSSLDVALSWEHEWERDYGNNHPENWDEENYGCKYDHLRPEKPEWVTLMRYFDDGSVNERYMSADGSDVIIDNGADQSVLVYNSDTEYIMISDAASVSDVRASATSRSRSPIAYLAERHPDVRSTNPPDVLYSAFLENLPDVPMHQKLHMPIKMQPLVYTYLVRYEFEEGLEHVVEARGALGGMAESVYLRNGVTSEDQTIILYDCTIESYGCEARVRSFGAPGFPDSYYGRAESPDRVYSLNLEVILTNGKVLQFNYDISDQIATQPRGGVITVKGLRIEPKEVYNESGFDVNVDSWGNHVDIDIPIDDIEYDEPY